MKYDITHKTKYAYSDAVSVCHNVVHLLPRTLPYQQCEHSRLLVHPEPVRIGQRQDYFGNRVSWFAIEQAHRGLTVTATSKVTVSQRPSTDTSVTWEQVRDTLAADRSPQGLEAVQFRFASASIKPFADLRDYAAVSFPPGRPMVEAVTELTARIHDEFSYDPRATTVHTPLEEAFAKRRGVCQDFAHLQIGCLRSLQLPARYVSGYLRTVPPPGKTRLAGADASHAWISVYLLNGQWLDLDPTNNMVASTDHITVAWGLDYTDVCPIQGVIVGGGKHTMTVAVDVVPIEETA